MGLCLQSFKFQTYFAKLLNESTHIDKMLKCVHFPEEIIRTVEKGEGLQRNSETDAFVITILRHQSCKKNFSSESEIHILDPVKKAAKISARPSHPYYRSASKSQQSHDYLNKTNPSVFRPKALWSTRDDPILSETDIHLSQADELGKV